jgi:spore maturation protein CgeB
MAWKSKPLRPVSSKLKPLMKRPVFGLEMFQALSESRIVLNIHIDTSPTHASNYRLFEATGIGACLLTDWKENLGSMFELDKEVVCYRSVDECVEKAQWLLDHPVDREKVAAAGQARTLKDHTFAHRAEQLDQLIRRELRVVTGHSF